MYEYINGATIVLCLALIATAFIAGYLSGKSVGVNETMALAEQHEAQRYADAFLDGYSKGRVTTSDTPISAELDQVFNQNADIVNDVDEW